jgi:hypothetical protein
MGFLNFQCFCPDLNLGALTGWLRALPGAFPNRVFKSEEGYFSTMSLSMLEMKVITSSRSRPGTLNFSSVATRCFLSAV